MHVTTKEIKAQSRGGTHLSFSFSTDQLAVFFFSVRSMWLITLVYRVQEDKNTGLVGTKTAEDDCIPLYSIWWLRDPLLSIKETLCPPRTNLGRCCCVVFCCGLLYYSIPFVFNVSDAMETVMLVPASHSLGRLCPQSNARKRLLSLLPSLTSFHVLPQEQFICSYTHGILFLLLPETTNHSRSTLLSNLYSRGEGSGDTFPR